MECVDKNELKEVMGMNNITQQNAEREKLQCLAKQPSPCMFSIYITTRTDSS